MAVQEEWEGKEGAILRRRPRGKLGRRGGRHSKKKT